MIFNVRSPEFLSESNLSKELGSLNAPALVIGNDFKIIAKTHSVNEFLSGVRRGSKVLRFLSEESVFAISEMPAASIFYTEFTAKNGTFSIAVIGGIDCRLVIFRPLFGEMFKSLENGYGKMSGYDTEIFDPELRESGFSDSEARLLNEILCRLKTVRGLPFFDAAAIIACISAEISKLQNDLSGRIMFFIPDKKLITNGNGRDFASAAVFAIMYCLSADKESEINVELKEQGGTLLLRISGNDSEFSQEAFNLSKLLKNPKVQSSKRLRLYSVKLLSDANLWDFKFSSGSFGESVFEIRSLFLKDGEEFLLREDFNEDISELIKTLFL